MEEAIGDQLLVHYGRKENGLFSMSTLTYDLIPIINFQIQNPMFSGEYTLSNSLHTSTQSNRYSSS